MLGDTIIAVASPPGSSRRGIIRVSGPAAFAVAQQVVAVELPQRRDRVDTAVRILGQKVVCFALTMPGPQSFTGEDCVELHLPGSPLLLEKVLVQLRVMARDALPGEFTRRAYEHGRLDLAEAEAVLDLIHAASSEERRHALHVLGGGLAKAVDDARSRIQDAHALLEAGLDFESGETGEVDTAAWLPGLEAVHEELGVLLAAIPPTRAGGDLLLLGATNAGKSSLCNALTGSDLVLVSSQQGTTRDVLAVEIGSIRLLDAPGDLPTAADPARHAVDDAAISLRNRMAMGVGSVVIVIDLSAPSVPETSLPVALVVFTKADLCPGWGAVIGGYSALWPAAKQHVISSVTGMGIEALRGELSTRGAQGPLTGGQRLGDRLREALAPLAMAIEAGSQGYLTELVATELQLVLAALDAVHGRSSPEHLLDRIFGRFCLGK